MSSSRAKGKVETYFGMLKTFGTIPLKSHLIEPHYESEAKCKASVMKIRFHSNANKTNFHMESFALSLAFIVSFTASRKWPIKV